MHTDSYSPQALTFQLLCLRNSFLWHPGWVLLNLCLGQLGNAGNLPTPGKSSFLIHGRANSKAHSGRSFRGPQRHRAPLMHTSLTFSTPWANKLSVPKSLLQVLLLRTLKLREIGDGEGKTREGSNGKEVTFEISLETQEFISGEMKRP